MLVAIHVRQGYRASNSRPRCGGSGSGRSHPRRFFPIVPDGAGLVVALAPPQPLFPVRCPAAAGVMQQQCGFCAAVSDLFRRMMCFSGSRRGSDQSYYHELDNDERLIVRPKVWFFFITVFC